MSLIYDDVVQESAILKGFPIFDLEGVEVLRGPQGTLFGRNTPAGVVKFNSVKPVLGSRDAYINLSAGNHGVLNIDGAASLPLGTQWALRASVLSQHRDDHVRVVSAQPGNLYTGQKIDGYDDRALRLQALYKPGNHFSVLFNVHGRDLDGSARLFRANILRTGSNALVPGFDENVISTNGKNTQQFNSMGGSINATWNLGAVSLHSITGYESIGHYFTRGDIDGGDKITAATRPFQVETGGGVRDHHQFTQEFRVASKFSGPFNYQAGVYFFSDKLVGESYGYDSDSGASFGRPSVTRQKNDAWALFASVNYDLTPDFKLRSGLRYYARQEDLRHAGGLCRPAQQDHLGLQADGRCERHLQAQQGHQRLCAAGHGLPRCQLWLAAERPGPDLCRS